MNKEQMDFQGQIEDYAIFYGWCDFQQNRKDKTILHRGCA